MERTDPKRRIQSFAKNFTPATGIYFLFLKGESRKPGDFPGNGGGGAGL